MTTDYAYANDIPAAVNHEPEPDIRDEVIDALENAIIDLLANAYDTRCSDATVRRARAALNFSYREKVVTP